MSFFSLVTELETLLEQLNTILAGAEDETVEVNGVTKDSISKAIRDNFSAIQALVQGRLAFETKAEMVAAGAPPSGELAEVWNDTPANNGLYGYSDVAWVKSSYDPFNEFNSRLGVSEGAATLTTPISNQLFGLTVSEKLRTYQAGDIGDKRVITSTFTGWAAPFDWDGTAFNMLKVFYNVEFPGSPLRVRIWSADKLTKIAETTVITTDSGFSWVPFSKLIDTNYVPAGILYYSMDILDKSSRVMPHIVNGYVDVQDASTINKQMYLTSGTGELLTNWIQTSSGTGYPPPVELYDISTLQSQNFIDLPKLDSQLASLRDVFSLITTLNYTQINQCNNMISSPAFTSRGEADDICGYGQTLQRQSGKSINAVSIPGLPTKSLTPQDQIKTIYVELRSTDSSGALLAEGIVYVKSKQNIPVTKVALKSPATGELITLTETDLPEVYWVGFWAENVSANLAAAGNGTATINGFGGSSQYKKISTGEWLTYSGNKSLAIETEYLASLSESEDYNYIGQLDLSNTSESKTLNKVIQKETKLQYESFENQNLVNSPGYNKRTAPFCGWGCDLYPVEDDINAIRLPFIGRTTPNLDTDKWSTILIEVRNGRCPTGSVLAQGSISVDPEDDLLTDLTILLLSPETLEPITLNNADFTSGFMGVTYRAVNDVGGQAVCGDATGSPDNFAGMSYYSVNNGSSWTTYSGNPPLGIQLLLVTNPTVAFNYKIRKTVELQSAEESKSVELYGADQIYALEGSQINLYFDNLVAADMEKYAWDTACSQGLHLDECFRLIASGSSNLALNVQIRDPEDGKNLWGEKALTVRVADSDSGNGATRKCLFIGDSTTAGGQYVGEVVNLASTDVMNITTIGTIGSGDVKHEGRGGWRVDDYTTAGREFFRFNVTGLTVEPYINSTQYAHNNSVYRVQENHLTNGDGYLILERKSGTDEPISSGNLVKDSGIGDDNIGFDSWSRVSGNPFWNDSTQRVDFSAYLAENALTIGTDDWVFIHLGINDVFGQTSDEGATSLALANVTKLNLLIDNIHSYNPNIRIAVMVTIPPCKGQSAFGFNYSSGQTRARYKRNILIYNQVMVNAYKDSEGSDVFLCPVQYTIDPVHGFPSSTTDVSSRSSEKVFRNTNSVHPNESGYYQMADEIWAFLKYWG
ncbi:hypothetical protein C7Y70_13265 [Pseudoalteromonas sp. KS88]|uniref:GDSL-type esterase/lipase family protein n=1 Tax=Pseudoalteromonas sp. KS88 TaxID=2109918 RepID=UPI001080F0E6|nr:GDSL-type esterase/lipase family protein [Pseudoalteromonas sp. KS88]TGE81371.1 hypothetical protein C7Y70_13265 [Pseudoalteromonas sp. KS88]